MQSSMPNQPPNSIAQSQATSQLARAYRATATNFYSIAIFSLVNSLIGFFQGGLYFPIGLGLTQVIDGLASGFAQQLPDLKNVVFLIGFVLVLLIDAVVALFGFFIAKRNTWLIMLGAGLYLLDGLMLLAFTDWFGAAFHAYFLFRIFVNWQLIRKLSANNQP